MTIIGRQALALVPPLVALALAACGGAAPEALGSSPPAAIEPATGTPSLSSSPLTTPETGLPGPEATPQEVVTAYIDTLNAQDFDTADRFWTNRPDDAATSSRGAGLRNIISITDLEFLSERQEGTGTRSRAAGYQQAVHLQLSFTLQQRQALSMPNGPNLWGYVLVRNSDQERWLIEDQGFV